MRQLKIYLCSFQILRFHQFSPSLGYTLSREITLLLSKYESYVTLGGNTLVFTVILYHKCVTF